MASFTEWVAGVARGLFRHDETTGFASVELWVVVPAVLVMVQFAIGSMGPRFVIARQINPGVQLLQILSYYSVSYTLGLMKPSISKHDSAATFNDFFQVWAVLIVTMQDSARIGRPYRPQEMTLVDLLSSLWSANQLRTHTALYLKAPLWVIWTIHAFRIIVYYVSSNRAAEASDDNVKLVSDYMAMLPLTHEDASVDTMEGYKYLVDGEDLMDQKIEKPSFTVQLKMEPPNELITVDKVWTWSRHNSSGDRLLSTLTDGDNRFKDVCLSFALYKMLRRRFYNLPLQEAKDPAVRRLVANAILEEKDGYKRAFRVTEVELSFLQDFSYSKHAVVFAGGFPFHRLILSSCMISAALYLAYAVRDLPSTSMARSTTDRVVRISHGVFITHFLIFIVVCRELWEIGVYVLSQWTKVVILCHYIRLKLRQEQRQAFRWSCVVSVRRRMVEMLARVMFLLVCRGNWNQKIQQHNLLMSNKGLSLRFVNLRSHVKTKIFVSLKALITSASSSDEENNLTLESYLGYAFPADNGSAASPQPLGDNGSAASPQPPAPQPAIKIIHDKLERDTHKILVWHVATSLCQIDLLEGENMGDDLYKLPKPLAEEDPTDVWTHYNTAATLSNYCVHLIKEALLPDNGLIASKVLEAVCGETRVALRGCRTRRKIYDKLKLDATASEGQPDSDSSTILIIGTKLDKILREKYTSQNELWERLAKFWARYLLYLSASTMPAKHRIHLQGRGELTTHLWVLLSHAGFLGKGNTHGQQPLNPVDLDAA